MRSVPRTGWGDWGDGDESFRAAPTPACQGPEHGFNSCRTCHLAAGPSSPPRAGDRTLRAQGPVPPQSGVALGRRGRNSGPRLSPVPGCRLSQAARQERSHSSGSLSGKQPSPSPAADKGLCAFQLSSPVSLGERKGDLSL